MENCWREPICEGVVSSFSRRESSPREVMVPAQAPVSASFREGSDQAAHSHWEDESLELECGFCRDPGQGIGAKLMAGNWQQLWLDTTGAVSRQMASFLALMDCNNQA